MKRHHRMAICSIPDQGIGITADTIAQMFHSPYRAPQAYTRDMPGYGLGLYFVKEIVLQHGGTLEATHVNEQGSTITITFPLLDN